MKKDNQNNKTMVRSSAFQRHCASAFLRLDLGLQGRTLFLTHSVGLVLGLGTYGTPVLKKNRVLFDAPQICSQAAVRVVACFALVFKFCGKLRVHSGSNVGQEVDGFVLIDVVVFGKVKRRNFSLKTNKHIWKSV